MTSDVGLRSAVLLAVVLAACAAPRAEPPRAAALPAPPMPLPRSSVAAVLARGGELQLTETEIARLGEIDEALARERSELSAARRAAPRPAAGGAGERPGGPAGPGTGGPGMGGPPPGRGRIPGEGQGPGNRGERGERKARPSADEDALATRLDDADTRAYLRAEEALEPSHRERAREIASAYREALYDRREATRKRGGRVEHPERR